MRLYDPNREGGDGRNIRRRGNKLTTTLRAIAAVMGPTSDSRIEDGTRVYIPGVGYAPRDLYDSGVGAIKNELASAIISIYSLSQNYDNGNVVSRSDLLLSKVLNVILNDAIVADVNPEIGSYDSRNIWTTREQSRALFAKKIGEALSRISDEQYLGLNPQLRAVVDHGKEIVQRQTLEDSLPK